CGLPCGVWRVVARRNAASPRCANYNMRVRFTAPARAPAFRPLVYAFAFLSNAEIERRPFIELALRPDPPAVALDHAPHQGKADTDPLEFVLAVQALKHVEQLLAVPHVEPYAVVAHEEHQLLVRSLCSDFDPRFRLS